MLLSASLSPLFLHFLQLSISHSLPPLLCDLAWGKQTCNVKALTTECMDAHTQQRERRSCVKWDLCTISGSLSHKAHSALRYHRTNRTDPFTWWLWSYSCNNYVFFLLLTDKPIHRHPKMEPRVGSNDRGLFFCVGTHELTDTLHLKFLPHS